MAEVILKHHNDDVLLYGSVTNFGKWWLSGKWRMDEGGKMVGDMHCGDRIGGDQPASIWSFKLERSIAGCVVKNRYYDSYNHPSHELSFDISNPLLKVIRIELISDLPDEFRHFARLEERWLEL